ncbi:DUF6346 domain-containing protein [Actinoplanes oblitus]|uniref:DUF6346 domain-containing protein n=1 Tax=Actinoplanes oblitus TaxID=3040509 RepID=A0ABY8WGJ0_9ACTN|nr:DUF6346 domain-containing protein [Actinoplanes oblitus]WIM96979.1 DUF6346 domain-containing protein [Actinoplanes oblitus]
MTDENRAAYRKRRMAEILAEAEANRARSRAARKAAEAVEYGPLAWLRTVLLALGLLAVSFLLIATAMTVSRFTGADFADADRTGVATVERCERRGPVSLSGFGYYNVCTVSIGWSGRSSVKIDKPGFFTDEKPGDTFTIGENPGSRGRVGYSRAEVPDRGWVTFIGVVIFGAGLIPVLFVVALVWEGMRRLFRRRQRP